MNKKSSVDRPTRPPTVTVKAARVVLATVEAKVFSVGGVPHLTAVFIGYMCHLIIRSPLIFRKSEVKQKLKEKYSNLNLIYYATL